LYYSILRDTPVGPLFIAGDATGLKSVLFSKSKEESEFLTGPEQWERSDYQLREAIRQLTAYFQGTLRQFDLTLSPDGTDFQKRVWRALCDVPYGETASYGEIARAIGQPTASRAVGMANGRNPISIIVPCHRIIGTNGRLTGYGGGLNNKETLLMLEGAMVVPH
jgi:methylated-DNA-[protein]-cysteine S-methyltransferase